MIIFQSLCTRIWPNVRVSLCFKTFHNSGTNLTIPSISEDGILCDVVRRKKKIWSLKLERMGKVCKLLLPLQYIFFTYLQHISFVTVIKYLLNIDSCKNVQLYRYWGIRFCVFQEFYLNLFRQWIWTVFFQTKRYCLVCFQHRRRGNIQTNPWSWFPYAHVSTNSYIYGKTGAWSATIVSQKFNET